MITFAFPSNFWVFLGLFTVIWISFRFRINLSNLQKKNSTFRKQCSCGNYFYLNNFIDKKQYICWLTSSAIICKPKHEGLEIGVWNEWMISIKYFERTLVWSLISVKSVDWSFKISSMNPNEWLLELSFDWQIVHHYCLQWNLRSTIYF